MLLVDEMREKVKSVYDNYTWKNKVDSMPNRQVIDIFYSMQEKGVFQKTDSSHQIDLDKYFSSINQKVG